MNWGFPSYGNIMGILWERYGNVMGTLWEYYWNIMGLSWEYHGNMMGIWWVSTTGGTQKWMLLVRENPIYKWITERIPSI